MSDRNMPSSESSSCPEFRLSFESLFGSATMELKGWLSSSPVMVHVSLSN